MGSPRGNAAPSSQASTGNTGLPAPLTAPACDLSDFQYMELDVRRLRDSKFAAAAEGEAFRAGILLWCAAWHQVPAASLPDDDVELANLAGYGRVLKEWKKVRAAALHGFVKCADGRLYHPVVAEKAIAAFAAKEKYAYERYCDRLRKENAKRAKENKPPLGVPGQALWKTGAYPHGMAPQGEEFGPVPQGGDFPAESGHASTPLPAETGLRGNRKERSRAGDGTGDGDGEGADLFHPGVAGATGGAAAAAGQGGAPGPAPARPGRGAGADGGARDAASMARDALWSAGKSLLLQSGMPRAQCGSFVGRLCKDYGNDIVVEAVRAACVARPADPAEYLKAVCMRAAGQRSGGRGPAQAVGAQLLAHTANRQEALEQRNRSVADAWALEAPGAWQQQPQQAQQAPQAQAPPPGAAPPMPSVLPSPSPLPGEPIHPQEPPHHASH